MNERKAREKRTWVGFLHSGRTGSADDLGCLRSAKRLGGKTHLEQSFEPHNLRQTNDRGRADPALVGDSGGGAEDNIQRIFTGSRSKLRRGLLPPVGRFSSETAIRSWLASPARGDLQGNAIRVLTASPDWCARDRATNC
jgi:hypothetical protein